MELPGSPGSPDEAENHKVNMASVIGATRLSLAAAPSSPGAQLWRGWTVELMQARWKNSAGGERPR